MGGYTDDASVVEAETAEESSAMEAEDEAEAEEPTEEEEPAEEAAEEPDEAEAEVSAAEVEDEEPATDEGDAVVSAQATSGTCGDNATWTLSNGTLTISGSGVVEEGTFTENSNIKTVVIGDSITAIDLYVFFDCDNLTSVTIGKKVTTIGVSAFEGCDSLTTVKGASGVKTVRFNCFDGTPWLEKQGDFPVLNGILLVYQGSSSKVTIPDSVTAIAEGAFCPFFYTFSSSLKSVTIPDSVTSIGTNAFSGTSLTSVTIGSGVTSIGSYAFDGCESLKTVTIPSSVTTIGEYAFLDCNKLASVTIPASVTSIGTKAFGYIFQESDETKVAYISYGLTIYGFSGSKAQTYAKNNGLTFVNLKKLTVPTVSSVKNTSSGVKITWKKISGVSGYIIYRKTGSGSYERVKKVTSETTLTYKDTGATSNGTKYTYKIIAYKNYNGTTYKSSYSSAKSYYRLTSPTISSLTNSASKKMTVKWDKNSKATGYQIQYSTSSDFSSYKTVTISSYKTVSKTISSLTKGKKYYVRVRAYKTVSGTKYYSAWSSTKSVKISK
ncbi:MAG: fibronectin type III domain-containing protein [Clostridiales bacterium]|nr:fibronectin type III domain-containing protein [Clostridiales bacterium]